jgi:hypothetical protein
MGCMFCDILCLLDPYCDAKIIRFYIATTKNLLEFLPISVKKWLIHKENQSLKEIDMTKFQFH